MTHPPCVRLYPAYPGNPRTRIEGESPLLRKRDIRSEESALASVSKDEARTSAYGAVGLGRDEVRFVCGRDRGAPSRIAITPTWTCRRKCAMPLDGHQGHGVGSAHSHRVQIAKE